MRNERIDIEMGYVINGSRGILVWELWEGFLRIFGGTDELKRWITLDLLNRFTSFLYLNFREKEIFLIL